MRKAKPKISRVVDGVVSAVSYPLERVLGPAVGRSVPSRRPSKCPLCRKRAATTEVMIGVVIVRVCDPCSDPVYKGIDFLAAITRLL